MRRFEAEYLRRTRAGMWEDSRDSLEPLALASHDRVLDVGCGTGELTRVLDAHCPGTVVGCDADITLLEHAQQAVPVVGGDANRLPFRTGSFDLVVCQALLINLPDPAATLTEFTRVSNTLVAAIEPDNSAVTVTSSVDAESTLEQRAREAYLDGVDTDVTLGANTRATFDAADIDVIATRQYDHEQTIAPPYDNDDLSDARRKATGAGLAATKATMLESTMTPEAYDDLRTAWREMGRDVVEQIQNETYRRHERVPFYVTVGRVSK